MLNVLLFLNMSLNILYFCFINNHILYYIIIYDNIASENEESHQTSSSIILLPPIANVATRKSKAMDRLVNALKDATILASNDSSGKIIILYIFIIMNIVYTYYKTVCLLLIVNHGFLSSSSPLSSLSLNINHDSGNVFNIFSL